MPNPLSRPKIRPPSKIISATLLILSLSLCGCDNRSDDNNAATPMILAPSSNPQLLADTTAQLWQLLITRNEKALDSATTLQQQIQELKSSPSDDTLKQAQRAWHETHISLQAMNSLFILGQTNPGLFKQAHERFLLVDAWPIEPGYLDSFSVYIHSGIVNDIAVSITEKSIRDQHGFTRDSDASLGLHAMAYLLWGEDQQRSSKDFDGSLSQKQSVSGLTLTETPQHRRATLLTLQATLLIDDLRATLIQLQDRSKPLALAYFALSAELRIQLWQQVISAQLNSLSLQLESAATVEAVIHNALSGNQTLTLAADVEALSELLQWQSDDSQPTLLELLIHQDDDITLVQELNSLAEKLRGSDKSLGLMMPAEKQQMVEQLQHIQQLFALSEPH